MSRVVKRCSGKEAFRDTDVAVLCSVSRMEKSRVEKLRMEKSRVEKWQVGRSGGAAGGEKRMWEWRAGVNDFRDTKENVCVAE